MLKEDFRETPRFVKGVVERRRRDANDIRLTKIAFHTRDNDFLVQLLRVLVC